MGFTHSLFQDEQRVTVIGEGPITIPDCFEAMDAVAEDDKFQPFFSVLVDLHSLEYAPSIQDVQHIASKLGTLKTHFQGKVAVLVSGDFLYGMLRMTCVMAEFVGFKMHAFKDYDEAIQWLMPVDTKIQSTASFE